MQPAQACLDIDGHMYVGWAFLEQACKSFSHFRALWMAIQLTVTLPGYTGDVLQCGNGLICPEPDFTGETAGSGAYCCKEYSPNDTTMAVYCCDYSTYVQYSTGLILMEFIGIFLACIAFIICGGVIMCYLFGWLCFRPALPFAARG